MPKPTSVTVFCGSQSGNDFLFQTHARQTGTYLAEQGIRMVYGGGNKGLMGTVANAVVEAGGNVIGIIPELLAGREHAHDKISDLRIVTGMHERKKMLYDLSEVFLILPGGYGTLDELFEAITWNQLTIHDKPIYLLNTAGFYNHLLQHLHLMQESGFLYNPWHESIKIFATPEELIQAITED